MQHGGAWRYWASTMKPITLISLTTSVLLSGSLLAGPPDLKQVAPAPPPCEYGTGWYAALEGGANVYQSFNSNFERDFPNGDVVKLHIDHNVGGYGGIKIGYVFGTGTFRPTIEEDMFYNGIPTSAHVDFNGTRVADSDNLINSGAFMTNFIMRFAFGRWRCRQWFPGLGCCGRRRLLLVVQDEHLRGVPLPRLRRFGHWQRQSSAWSALGRRWSPVPFLRNRIFRRPSSHWSWTDSQVLHAAAAFLCPPWRTRRPDFWVSIGFLFS